MSFDDPNAPARAPSTTRVWRSALWIGLTLVAVALAGPGVAWGQPAYVVPYDGVLQRDGTGVSSELGMRFALVDSSGAIVWQEEWSAEATRSCAGQSSCLVPAYRGRFSVNLGTYAPGLDGLLRLGDRGLEGSARTDLYVTVSVLDDDQWVALGGRQELAMVPYALWALETDDLYVTDTLQAGQLSLPGGQLNVAGTLDVPAGTLSASLLATDLVTSAGDIVSSGDLDVAGLLQVGSDLHVGASTLAEEESFGPHVLMQQSGTTLQFNSESNFSTGVEIRGDTTFDQLTGTDASSLRVNNELRFQDDISFTGHAGVIRHDIPMVVFKFLVMDFNVTQNTFISASDYYCWLGGVEFIGGQLCTGDRGSSTPAFQYFAHVSGGTWHVTADWHSCVISEGHRVVVACVQDGMIEDYTGGAGF